MKYNVSSANKAFIYRTLKKMLDALNQTPSSSRQFMKLILKFTPGDDILYINSLERSILLSWLYRIRDASLVRADKPILKRVTDIIEGLSKPYEKKRRKVYPREY